MTVTYIDVLQVDNSKYILNYSNVITNHVYFALLLLLV